jgi:hypothetical protein
MCSRVGVPFTLIATASNDPAFDRYYCADWNFTAHRSLSGFS